MRIKFTLNLRHQKSTSRHHRSPTKPKRMTNAMYNQHNKQQTGKNVPSSFRVKLTGDGTQIGRGFTVVNVAFTMLEEGEKAHSAAGNHCIGIFKVCESDYNALYEALH